MDELQLSKKFLLTEGIMLAVVPAIIYFFAYQYEVGYFNAFGAPVDLISVDLTSIITFGIAAFGIWSILYTLLKSLWYSWFINIKEMSWKQLLLKVSPLFFIFCSTFYLIYPFSWFRFIFYLALFTFLTILTILIIKWDIYPKWLISFIFLASLSIVYKCLLGDRPV